MTFAAEVGVTNGTSLRNATTTDRRCVGVPQTSRSATPSLLRWLLLDFPGVPLENVLRSVCFRPCHAADGEFGHRFPTLIHELR